MPKPEVVKPPTEPAPRTRLACVRTSVALPDGRFQVEGGDIWMEHLPFPHVRVSGHRYPLDKVVYWRLPSDLLVKAKGE